ncbi:hypothetical protein EG358_01765 [Chryseobacterium indoltheticum]|nr:hypothetical protein EAG08_10830 [Chryseobacterium sp. 3008163]AZA72558.1 hypothetical protein EG358_01765 [Chryseobacterium indoltheticum]
MNSGKIEVIKSSLIMIQYIQIEIQIKEKYTFLNLSDNGDESGIHHRTTKTIEPIMLVASE